MRWGFVGAGNMGEALIGGLVRSGTPATDVWAVDASDEKRAGVRERYGVQVLAPEDVNSENAGLWDGVVVAVKPHQIGAVLRELSPKLRGDAVVISVAAGVTLATLRGSCAEGQPVVRAMPNTPALVGAGMTALCGDVEETLKSTAEAPFAAVGDVLWVDESQMDAVTAVSGSGPAYVARFTEVLADAGVQEGLPREVALRLAKQTVMGMGKLMVTSDVEPDELRRRVTSPGGTTQAGLEALENADITKAVSAAVRAAATRSKELG